MKNVKNKGRSPKELELFISSIIVQAGKRLQKHFQTDFKIETKSHDNDVLTIADKESNEIIMSAIKKRFPQDDILSEEVAFKPNGAEYTWIIDPLDGTLNFSKGIPLCGVLIAVAIKKEVIASGMYMPMLHELYLASKGNGATLNGKKISCGTRPKLQGSWGNGSMSIHKKNAKWSKRLFALEKTQRFWFSCYSSLIFDASLVANGKADWMFFPSAGGAWDFAAASLVLQEAGCKVTQVDGSSYTPFDTDMLAANPRLHKDILRLLKKK